MIKKIKINLELKDIQFLNRIKMPFAKISDDFDNKLAKHENFGFTKTAGKKTLEHPGTLQFPEDFDLRKDMLEHADNLYVKALAIIADEPNDNGDYFSKEELTKSYHTFVGCPLFVNHKNDDVEEARGTIIYAEWSEKDNGVMVIGRVDAKAYPKLARGIAEGYISGVSMGAQVDYSECSICGNQAAKEDQYCLVAGTKITMADKELKNIEDVNSGDMVLTHDGTGKEVKEIMVREVEEPIYEIYFSTSNIPLEVTGNHPILLLEKLPYRKTFIDYFKNNFNPKWKNVSEIEIGQYVLSPKYKVGNKYSVGKDFARLLGIYLAKGVLFKQKYLTGKKIDGIEFSISLEEDELKNNIIDLCKKITGRDAKVYIKPSTYQIRICDRELSNNFYNICGEHAKTKYIGSEVFTWHPDEIKEFICGYIDGDGYFLKEQNNFHIRTASEFIALQIQKLLSITGSWASIYKCDNSENEVVKYTKTENKDTFSINIPNFLSNNVIVGSCLKSKEFEKITNTDRTSHWQYENYDIVKIRKIVKKEFKGHVFNFSVKDNENYIANNVIVHNCSHIKEHKTRKYNGKDVYEKNYGVKFIELSFVVDPACSTCYIQEIYDVDDLREKVAEVKEFIGKFRKVASKTAGKDEVSKLNQAENLIQEVAKTMLDQKANLELTYVTDLVEALAKLQQTKDELVDMGYESLETKTSVSSTETPASTNTATPITPTPPVAENLSTEKGQNLEEQNIPYENVGAMPAGEVGSVTMPGAIAIALKNRLTKNANKINLSKVFKDNLRKKWNKE